MDNNRGPEYCHGDINTWFKLLDVHFIVNNVSDSKRKFARVLSLLPIDVQKQTVETLQRCINSRQPYKNLKKDLLEQLQPKKSVRLQQILTIEMENGEKPSETFQRMKRILGDMYNSFDKEMLKTLFLQRLPTDIQLQLITKKDADIQTLTRIADEAATIIEKRNFAGDKKINGLDSLQYQIDQLSRQIRYQQPYRRPYRPCNTSYTTTPEFCYNHQQQVYLEPQAWTTEENKSTEANTIKQVNNIKENTESNIQTTRSPINAKTTRLPPERSEKVNEEFEAMLKQTQTQEIIPVSLQTNEENTDVLTQTKQENLIETTVKELTDDNDYETSEKNISNDLFTEQHQPIKQTIENFKNQITKKFQNQNSFVPQRSFDENQHQQRIKITGGELRNGQQEILPRRGQG